MIIYNNHNTQMNFGYIRTSKGSVSAADQNKALQAARCDKIVEEGTEGKGRPELIGLAETLQAGDAVTVTSLDRLAPILPQLLSTLADLSSKSVHIQSLQEQIDTRQCRDVTDGLSQVLRGIVAAARAMLIERVQEGRANVIRKGAKLGRRRKLTDDQIEHAQKLLALGESGRIVARTFGISEATLYRRTKLRRL